MNIEEIEARAKAAMPGPWKDIRDQADEPNVAIVSRGLIIAHLGDFYPEAKFVAHAREDIPYLLAELREAREKLGAVEELKDELYAHHECAPQDLTAPEVIAERLDRILHPKEGG